MSRARSQWFVGRRCPSDGFLELIAMPFLTRLRRFALYIGNAAGVGDASRIRVVFVVVILVKVL